MISYRPDAVRQKEQRRSTDLSLLVINVCTISLWQFPIGGYPVGVNFGAKIPTNVSTLITRLFGTYQTFGLDMLWLGTYRLSEAQADSRNGAATIRSPEGSRTQ